MSRGDSTAAFLSALATDLLAERDEPRTATAIVTRAVETITDADHAILSVRSTSRRRRDRVTILGSSGATADRVQHLQTELGEGPDVDTLGEAEWVRSGDVSVDPRWSSWGPQAASAGVCSVLSVQLTAGGEPFGALTWYAERAGRFVDPDLVDLALLFSVHAANAMASAQQLAGLRTAMSSRHVIGMAQGLLMERYRLDEQQAFAYLSRVSSHQNRKLRELAADVVRTRELPEPVDRSLLEDPGHW